jgi:iron complex outermembrane receptor protein
MINKIIYISALLSFLISTGKAQTTLTGQIIDYTTRKPLIGVNVLYLPDLKSGTTTNHSGIYYINLPSQKKVKIQYLYLGYKTVLKTIITDSFNYNLNVALEAIPLESEAVVISGISTSTQCQNAINIETIKAQEIETSGSPNLIESISSIPGVSMVSRSPGVSMPVIRGLTTTNIIVMNNSVKLENFHYSKEHAFIIDEFGVEQVEVIKGPASLLYGSGAVEGVINFIKEKPLINNGIEGDYTGHYHSNTMGFCNSFGVKSRKNDFYWGIRGGYKNHTDYLDGNGNFIPNTRFNDKSFKVNGGVIKSFGSFNLYYDYNRPQMGMYMKQSLPLVTERGRKLQWWYQDLSSHIISSRNKLFIRKYKLDINASCQVHHRTGWTDTTTLPNKLVEATMTTFGYEVKTHLPSNDKSEYIIGVQGENGKNRNHDAPVDLIPNADVTNVSLFGFVQHILWNKLKTQGGIRYDYSYIYMFKRRKGSYKKEL